MCGQALADKFKLDYIEASAKSGQNVELIFRLLAESLDLAHKSAAQKTEVESSKMLPRAKISGADTKLRLYKHKRISNVEAAPQNIKLDYEPKPLLESSSSYFRCCII